MLTILMAFIHAADSFRPRRVRFRWRAPLPATRPKGASFRETGRIVDASGFSKRLPNPRQVSTAADSAAAGGRCARPCFGRRLLGRARGWDRFHNARKGDAFFSGCDFPGCDGPAPSSGPTRPSPRLGRREARSAGLRPSSGRRGESVVQGVAGTPWIGRAELQPCTQAFKDAIQARTSRHRPQGGGGNEPDASYAGAARTMDPRPRAKPRERLQRTRRRASRKKLGESRGRRTATSCHEASSSRRTSRSTRGGPQGAAAPTHDASSRSARRRNQAALRNAGSAGLNPPPRQGRRSSEGVPSEPQGGRCSNARRTSRPRKILKAEISFPRRMRQRPVATRLWGRSACSTGLRATLRVPAGGGMQPSCTSLPQGTRRRLLDQPEPRLEDFHKGSRRKLRRGRADPKSG